MAEVGWDQLDIVGCLPASLGSKCGVDSSLLFSGGVPGGWGSGVVAPREHSSQAGPGQHALITQATRKACSSPTARLSLCKNWGVDPEPTAGMGPKETQYWRPSSLFSSVCFFYSITAISVSLRRGHSVKVTLASHWLTIPCVYSSH